uniref:Ig-like domain-containing protein n=1 Tax=Hucho hucho TaxID=62062 RepID=A0A4W5LYC5_9TELE
MECDLHQEENLCLKGLHSEHILLLHSSHYPSGEIVEGTSVTLSCNSDANPTVDKYTWYKKNVTSPKASGQSYSITNIISEDRGEYYCEAQNGRGSMNSTALMIIVTVGWGIVPGNFWLLAQHP